MRMRFGADAEREKEVKMETIVKGMEGVQQAAAIIAARHKIVEGAVSMVKMAINQLSEEEVVVLDEERKAAMVSNMLVVLCGNKNSKNEKKPWMPWRRRSGSGRRR